MKVTPVLLCLVIFSLSPAWGDAVSIENHTKQLIADLTAYVDLHPEAPDLDRAYGTLAQSYAELGDKPMVLGLMEKRYHLNKNRRTWGWINYLPSL